jgi:hypothetical protein
MNEILKKLLEMITKELGASRNNFVTNWRM